MIVKVRMGFSAGVLGAIVLCYVPLDSGPAGRLRRQKAGRPDPNYRKYA